MAGRGKRALRLTRDHKPSVAGESERIRGAGGEVNQQCAPARPPWGPACLCSESVPDVGGATSFLRSGKLTCSSGRVTRASNQILPSMLR